ncbi:HAMP domain-containing protein [Denitrobaculum tricleocarpae]|uniref:histidine kinase n=1 Tax=Denitrobaculum tricleocarpae TaxID=2591009 RepID=A0A545TQ96_9PROT|nr:HAMP domain-containing protein [Denitrobaculum tricleocarpae]
MVDGVQTREPEAPPASRRARKHHSLRRRLLLLLLLPLSLTGVLAMVDAYRDARTTANEISDRVLSGSALAIAERVIVGADGVLEVDVPYVALEMLTSSAQDRVFYRVEGPDGAFITGYEKLPVPAEDFNETIGNRARFSDASFRGDAIRVATMDGAVSTGKRSIPYRVVVAETTNARQKLARDILIRTAIRQALLVGIAAIIVWIGVTRALRPLQRLEEAIGRRSMDDLRPIEHAVPSEVEQLVVSINGFMQRLGGALGALRNFTGNASHQLRTPLTVIRTQLELTRRAQSNEDASAALQVADGAVTHAERALTQLLLLARVDEASADRLSEATFDLGELAQTTTASYLAKARERNVDLGYDPPSGQVVITGDAMLLGELLRNLIENVIAYAGEDVQATVRVGKRGESAFLEVEDDGVGLDPDKRTRALERFVRFSSDHQAGAGLGLSIVAEIAALFGARLSLDAGGRGEGLLARVVFPKKGTDLSSEVTGTTSPEAIIRQTHN